MRMTHFLQEEDQDPDPTPWIQQTEGIRPMFGAHAKSSCQLLSNLITEMQGEISDTLSYEFVLKLCHALEQNSTTFCLWPKDGVRPVWGEDHTACTAA